MKSVSNETAQRQRPGNPTFVAANGDRREPVGSGFSRSGKRTRVQGTRNRFRKSRNEAAGKCQEARSGEPAGGGQRTDHGGSFEKMYLDLRHRFLTVAYSILRNKEDAEDAVQEAMISGYRNLPGFEGRSVLATWFTRIVINASLMILRKRKASQLRFAPESSAESDVSWAETIPAPKPDPEMLYAEAETFRLVDALLDEASPMLGEAFRLKLFEELSTREGARHLGVTPTTFKARVFRARRHLVMQAKYSLIAPLGKPGRSGSHPGEALSNNVRPDPA